MKLWENYLKNSTMLLVPFCLVLMVVAGCGVRKTAKERIVIKHDTIRIENNYELKQNNAFNDILELKPIDSSKPIIYNGVSYYNASIRFDKSKIENVEIKGNETLSQGSTDKTEIKKNTESKNQNLLWIGIVSVVGLIILAYILIRYYIPKIN